METLSNLPDNYLQATELNQIESHVPHHTPLRGMSITQPQADTKQLATFHRSPFFPLLSAVPKPGTVIKIPETGTTVTYSTTTAESVAPNGTKVTLHGLDLWSEFHKSTTEMIITKAGR